MIRLRAMALLVSLLLIAWGAACTSTDPQPASGGDRGSVAEHEHPTPQDKPTRNPHYKGPESGLPEPAPDAGEPSEPDLDAAPDWIRVSCDRFYPVDKPALCARGKAADSRDPALGRATAAARARVALLRRLADRISALRVHFIQTVHIHEAPPTTDQVIERLKLSLDQDADWVSPSGAVYVLVSIKQADLVKRLETENIHDEEFAHFLLDYRKYLFHPGNPTEPVSP